jgi:hypothetical protein
MSSWKRFLCVTLVFTHVLLLTLTDLLQLLSFTLLQGKEMTVSMTVRIIKSRGENTPLFTLHDWTFFVR